MSTLLAYLIVGFHWFPVVLTFALVFLVIGVLAVAFGVRKWGVRRTMCGAVAASNLILAIGLVWLGTSPMGHLPASSHLFGPATTNDLNQLHEAILMYAADNSGHLPSTLGAAFHYVDSGEVFVTEGSGTRAPLTREEADRGQCDYLYFGAGKTVLGLDGGTAAGKRTEALLVLTTRPQPEGTGAGVCVVYFPFGLATVHTSVPDDIRALWSEHGIEFPKLAN